MTSDNEITPLTKKGIKSKAPQIEIKDEVQEQEYNEKGLVNQSETIEPLISKKSRPPKSEKQIEAFKVMQEKRSQSIMEKKKEKLLNASKVLIENSLLDKPQPQKPKTKVVIKEVEEVDVSDESSSDDEELERIVHQRIKEHMLQKQQNKEQKKAPKAPKKKVEYSDSESEEEIQHKPPHTNWGRSTQNRKSSLKVQNKPNIHDYFCD